jgi:hypothetical protein
MTHYGEPNNHIFFNVLNSLVPGKTRFQPERARFLSFVFVILALVAMLAYQALHGRFFEGSFQVFLFVANIPNLDLILQARGYGFLALAAIACTILTEDYFRKPSLVPLVGIPTTVWLGTWAVPTFIFFGGPLLLVLLIYTRDWRWCVSGACALLAVCLVYWPVWHQVMHSSETYAAEWGKRFANWDAIGNLFSMYLFFAAASWVTFLVATFATVIFLLGRIDNPAEKASLCLGLSILLTFIMSLKLETPDNHTVAFTVVPFAFIMATVLARIIHLSAHRFVGLLAMSIITVIALAFAHHVRKTFHFIPKENWLETAHTIEQRFPKGTEIVARFRPQWLSVYLSKNYSLTREFEPSKFLAGKQIVVDSSFKRKERFAVTKLPPGYTVMTVPQRRGQSQKIYFWPQSQ